MRFENDLPDDRNVSSNSDLGLVQFPRRTDRAVSWSLSPTGPSQAAPGPLLGLVQKGASCLCLTERSLSVLWRWPTGGSPGS